MIEKEYKFLVNSIPIKQKKIEHITQIYFNKSDLLYFLTNILFLNDDELKKIKDVRLRITEKDKDKKYFLTAKTKGLKSRKEFEKEIDKNITKQILKCKPIGIVEKDRYKIKHKDYVFEFDEYKNIENLIVCEVEVKKNNDNYKKIVDILKNDFKLQIKDVTKKEKYKNYNLANEVLYENNKWYNWMGIF